MNELPKTDVDGVLCNRTAYLWPHVRLIRFPFFSISSSPLHLFRALPFFSPSSTPLFLTLELPPFLALELFPFYSLSVVYLSVHPRLHDTLGSTGTPTRLFNRETKKPDRQEPITQLMAIPCPCKRVTSDLQPELRVLTIYPSRG